MSIWQDRATVSLVSYFQSSGDTQTAPLYQDLKVYYSLEELTKLAQNVYLLFQVSLGYTST